MIKIFAVLVVNHSLELNIKRCMYWCGWRLERKKSSVKFWKCLFSGTADNIVVNFFQEKTDWLREGGSLFKFWTQGHSLASQLLLLVATLTWILRIKWEKYKFVFNLGGICRKWYGVAGQGQFKSERCCALAKLYSLRITVNLWKSFFGLRFGTKITDVVRSDKSGNFQDTLSVSAASHDI